ncbi:MAG: hypothetical protein KAS32_13075, partial [Candidatus Peribacteraceae bacterium]|nr:hypothetical protein [Candidatus Peribacteraceae bacterium]
MAQSIESVTDPDTTETDSFAIAQGARVVVRNSAGIPYVVVENLTEDAICVYKGNATEPTSFAEKDDGNNPTGTIYGSCSAAIDSDDIIHIAYMLDDGKDSQLLYCTFDADAGGSTDTFAGVDTVIVDDLGEDPTAIANLQSAIAIDSNDKPHIAYVGNVKSGGDTNFTVSYVNKTGASWTASPVEVEGVTNTVDCKYPDICIDADDIPVISYLNDTDDTADYGYGNANDATSFTLGVLDATALSGSSTSVCVDSSGDHFFASVDADGTILGHWINSDWSSFGLVRDTGTTGSSPTIVADGTDVYVFYEDADNDIAYSKSTDNCVTWDPNGTALDEGTFNTVKAKWTFCVDNDSGGALVTAFTPGRIDTYSFDASLNTTPGTPDDPDSKWSSDDNAFDGSVDTDADASTIGSTSANFLLGKGTTAPSSGSATITKVRARIYSDNSASLAIARSPIYTEGLGQRLSSTDLVPYNASVGEDWGIYTTLNIPTGGWTWDKLSKLETKTYITSDTPGTASRIEIEVTRAAIYTRSSSSELDYVFLDETGSPDVQFNSLSLVAAGDDYYETPSDSLSISEALANKTTLSVSDSQSIAESPVVVNEFYRDLSDTLSISEALATDVAISLADTLAFAESLEKAVSLVLADGITFADSEIEEPVKFLTDSISIAESLAVVNEFYKDLSDVLPIAESLAGSTGLSLSDSLTIAEEPSFIRGVYIELADSIGMIESLAKDISAELTDSLSISESLSIGVVHSLSDSIGFAESLVRGVDLGLSEPLPIAESLANKSTLGLSDAITFAESLAHDEEYYRELADSQGIAESLALTVGKPLSDSLAINESISMKPGLGLADSQTFSEQITKIAVGLGLSDLLPISYSLANSHSLVLSDTLSVAESLAITNTFEREFSDSILITEEVDPVIIIKLNLDDSISIAESLVVRAGKGLTESLVIAESPATTSEFYLELSDSITFADSEIEITEKVLVDSQGFAESIEK